MFAIDLNADVGESETPEIDETLLALATSANIACGAHAGDEKTMSRAVQMALVQGIRIGAHPSYPDRENFGRVSMRIESRELRSSLVEQIHTLNRIASGIGGRVEYVKPHGALYNDAAKSEEIADVVFDVADHFSLSVMALAGSPMAGMHPHRVILEGFIDRSYRDDGTLIPRTEPGAIIMEPGAAAAQALRLAPRVDSLCVHSDTPNAPMILRAARETLTREGYTISAK